MLVKLGLLLKVLIKLLAPRAGLVVASIKHVTQLTSLCCPANCYN